jgi:hypothetical protein
MLVPGAKFVTRFTVYLSIEVATMLVIWYLSRSKMWVFWASIGRIAWLQHWGLLSSTISYHTVKYQWVDETLGSFKRASERTAFLCKNHFTIKDLQTCLREVSFSHTIATWQSNPWNHIEHKRKMTSINQSTPLHCILSNFKVMTSCETWGQSLLWCSIPCNCSYI